MNGYVPLSVHRKANASLEKITVEFFVNNRKAKEIALTNDDAFDLTVDVPADTQDKIAQLTIRVSDVINPARAGIGPDQRDLGIIITEIRVRD